MKILPKIIVGAAFFGALINFLSAPELQAPTLKYQLKNDIEHGDAVAIEYFEQKYYAKNKDIFNDNFQTYETAVKKAVENVENVENVETAAPQKESLGIFTITAYCPCEKCCGKSDKITASGKIAQANHTIAMSKKYSFGTKIEIDGVIYEVEDRGGKIKGNKVDIFFENHEDALKFGKQKKEIFLIKGEN